MTDHERSRQAPSEEVKELPQRTEELENFKATFRQIEEKLILFKSIVEMSSEAIAVNDPEGRILYINKAHETLFGLTKDQAEGSDYRRYYPPESIQVLDNVVAPSLARGESWEGILDAIDSDGRRFPLWERADTIRNDAGEVIFCFRLMRDFSEERKAKEELEVQVAERSADLVEANERLQNEILEHSRTEQALEESEERYHQLADVTFEGLAFHEDGYILDANHQYYEMFGYSREELNGKQVIPLTVAPESLEVVRSHVDRGNSQSYEAVGLRKDGTKFPIEVRVRSKTHKDRTVRAAAIRDMTVHKEVEAELRERDTLLQAFYEGAKEALFLVEVCGQGEFRFVGWNRAGENITGVRSVDAEGRTPEKVFGPNVGARISTNYGHCVEQGHYSYVEQFGEPSSPTWSQTNLTAIHGQSDRVTQIVGVAMDITDRKKAEDTLRASEELLQNILTASTVGICFAEDREIRWANESMIRMFGYEDAPEEEFIGKSAEIIYPTKDEYERVGKIMYEGFKLGKESTTDAVFKRRDGSLFHGHIKMSAPDPANPMKGTVVTVSDITERKKAEMALRDSEELYRRLVETTDTGYVIIDGMGRVLDANAEYVRLTGNKNLEEILGRSVVDWTAEHDKNRNAAEVKKCLEKGFVRNLEIEYADSSGKFTPIELNATVIDGKDGQKIVTLCRDITDRKKTEDALSRSEEKYRLIFENIQDAYYETLVDGTVVEVSPSIKELSGYRREELIGASMYNLHSDPEQRAKLMMTVAQQGSVNDYELLLRDKDGSLVPCSITARLLRDEDGTPYKSCGTLRNISDRKKAEDALRASEHRLRQVIDLVPHMIFAKDEEGRFLLVNRAVTEAYNTTVEELTGQKHAVYHEDEEELGQMLNDDMEVIKSGRAKYIPEESFTDSQGRTRLLQTVKIPFAVSGLSKPAMLGVSVDVTDQKRAERQVKASLKEKEVLLREIHHRVKNNLAVVNSLLRLQARNVRDEYHRQMFVDAQNRIKSMALAHEKLSQTENLAYVNMTKYVAGLVDHLFLTDKGIGSTVNMNRHVENVHLGLDTAIPLGFLINELVSNALKHAHPNNEPGSIDIFLQTVGQDGLELIVKDDGVGMPESVDLEDPKSFGLNLIKLFTRQLHGVIELIRESGTKFRIRFKDSSFSGKD